ncbi:NAD(FAD)-utilizing dehydrogenase [Indibacter alkaliphilus LW1]|uniref:NAD(FAD)-utilizing dehydrogenase n=1 Tax=Indibacter alkaliphilus (strain CCUG 57479 / KCTC 22604 / LW1) TaxID=1189612 RepID=S2E9N1_INDAL|nr:FAD-binding protein [Indibacter alkaliphilus]EOZ99013.1 NAD(FAD)-utilizing dehydrogenase [Indibacter alkaliphilus LW1]
MKKDIQLQLSPEEAYTAELFEKAALRKVGISPSDSNVYVRQTRRSIDARGRNVKINVSAEVFVNEAPKPMLEFHHDYPNVSNADQIIIVGAGPAGLFAALRAIELGVKPIVIERGKDVRARRRDLAAINKEHIVNPESNYCFGEGGAGTYSDGKLYTRSKKRGDIRRIMEILVAHGATEEILVEAHPHIGTNKLPKLVADLRESILQAGGEVLFDSKVVDFILEDNEMKGVELADGERILGKGVILATGHSARDIFHLLNKRKILIEAKPFALGVRIEHSQNLIDRIQYNCTVDRGPFLPAAAYSLVNQTHYQGKQRGVFSFCMCPGGFIVPAATSPGELVVNGMSPSRRDSKYANSGMVVAVELEDLPQYQKHGALAAMVFQAEVEQKAWEFGGKTQVAPAQRMIDFTQKKVSSSLLETSYQPGLNAVDMHEVLPDFISERLRQGLLAFGKKMKGYLTNEAQLIGVESRTSSPVRIPRDKETFEHPVIKGLYPCGEGAGYAGGIVSAAMDGERCAERLIAEYVKR